jgi:hypothetical protein
MTTFHMGKGGLLLPGSAPSGVPVPTDRTVVYLKPQTSDSSQRPTLAAWTERGLIIFRNMSTGAEERHTLETVEPRLRSMEQLLDRMYKADFKYPSERQELAANVDKFRQLVRMAKEFGGPYTPGAAEDHYDRRPKMFAVSPKAPFPEKAP